MRTDTWRRIEAGLPLGMQDRWGVLADGRLHERRTFGEYHEAWKASREIGERHEVTIRQVGRERIRQPSSLCRWECGGGTRPPIADLLVGPIDPVGAPKAPRTRVRMIVDTGTTHSFLTKETIDRLGLPPVADAILRIESPTAATDVGRHEASWATTDGLFLPAPMLVGQIPALECDADGVAGFDILRHIVFEYEGRTGRAVLSARAG